MAETVKCPYCAGVLKVVGVEIRPIPPPNQRITPDVVRRELGDYAKLVSVTTEEEEIVIKQLNEWIKTADWTAIMEIVNAMGGKWLSAVRVWVV